MSGHDVAMWAAVACWVVAAVLLAHAFFTAILAACGGNANPGTAARVATVALVLAVAPLVVYAQVALTRGMFQ